MLTNSITLTDGTTPLTYDLVSRQGMSSGRREDGADSDVAGILEIKNTVAPLALTTKNRHLIKITVIEKDADGVYSTASVHASIVRDKAVSDAAIISACGRLSDFLATTADVEDVLVGGN